MDLDAVIKLMDRAEKSSFNKVEIQIGDLRLSLERGGAAASGTVAPLQKSLIEAATEPEETDAIRSPISGVFYLTKEPGAEPFVSAGCRVKKGDTLCIIEAMKTMNAICAPHAGIVAGILAGDGATVTAGDALFLLREEN